MWKMDSVTAGSNEINGSFNHADYDMFHFTSTPQFAATTSRSMCHIRKKSCINLQLQITMCKSVFFAVILNVRVIRHLYFV